MTRTNAIVLVAAFALGIVFTAVPSLDIAIARAVGIDRESPWYATVSLLREGFKTFFALSSVLVAAAALPLLLGGGFARRLWSTAALFVAAVLTIGAGVITNLIFKVYWGRARPHQVSEFGGEKAFSPIGFPSDQTSWNGSMPSGEAASIFALMFGLAAVAPKEWRRPLIATGCVLGSLAGLIRMGQLGHWASDVIAAGLLMFGTAFGLRWLLVDGPRAPMQCLADMPVPQVHPILQRLVSATRPRLAALGINAASWAVTLLAVSHPAFAEPNNGFAPAAIQRSPSGERVYVETTICENCGPVAHAGSLVLRGGALHAFWFQGSGEAKWDVSIQHALFDGSVWSAARKVIDTQEMARGLKRYNKTLANPVATVLPNGRMILFVTAVSMRGFATAYLVAMTSDDGGQSWSEPRRLITSPLWNISTLTKTPPIALANGNIGLPVHFELTAKWLKYPFLAEVDPVSLRVVATKRMGLAGSGLQPATVALSDRRAVAFLRKNWGVGDRVGLRKIESHDGGATWIEPRETGFQNPGGPVGLVSLGDDGLVLIFNEQSEDSLAVARSMDGGASWKKLGPLSRSVPASRADAMEAYPFAIAGPDGMVDVIYSGEKQSRMRHVRFNTRWLDDQATGVAVHVR